MILSLVSIVNTFRSPSQRNCQ